MLPSVKLYRDSVVIYYSNRGKVFRYNTKIHFKDDTAKIYYSDKHSRVKDIHPNAKEYNGKISVLLERATDIVTKYQKESGIDIDVEVLRNEFKSTKSFAEKIVSTKHQTFLQHYNDFIEVKKGQVKSETSMKDYISVRNSIIDYQTETEKVFTIQDVNDMTFLRKFQKFLSEKRPNTTYDYKLQENDNIIQKRKYITTGGINDNVFDKRMDCLLNFYKKYLIKKMKLIVECDELDEFCETLPSKYKVEAIALTIDELKTLCHLNVEEEKYKKIRDVFVFLCLTSLRYSDLINVSRDKISKQESGYVLRYKANQKTKTQLRIPLEPRAYQILEEYNFNMNIFVPQVFNRELKFFFEKYDLFPNDIIYTKQVLGKELSEKFKKRELLSSHSGRRTYVTSHLKKGTPHYYVMQATGHKKLETLLKYADWDLDINHTYIHNI